ncbi:hydroxylysine kinase-like [Babylonia areolata]|uniref:hydroxylysine kinase-like n=1 Tax=Babylonia areolata TaxID=304850 RepID=UPI003FD3F584
MTEAAVQNGAPTISDENRNEKDNSLGKPAQFIAPEVPDGYIQKIAKEMFGFTVTQCRELNSFRDKNYHIHVTPTSSNPHVTSVRPEGYVMKVMNSQDMKNLTLYAQVELMRHLHKHGICVQESVPTIQGEHVAFYDFPSCSGEGEVKTHPVCLRTFMPGTVLHDVTLTPDLCYQIGELVASLTIALEDFHHPFYDTFDGIWTLHNITRLKNFVHVITDVRRRRVVDDVIEEVCSKVLPRRSEIRAGQTHGDPNEHNIIVRRRDTSSSDGGSNISGGSDVKEGADSYVIAGILDYQEATYSHPLYDLSVASAYTMLLASGTFHPLEVVGHILAGYTSKLELPGLERTLLRACVAGRLVQSLVIGAYSHSLNPGNPYVLQSSRAGWRVLHALWDTAPEAVQELWDRVQRSYRGGGGSGMNGGGGEDGGYEEEKEDC